MIRGRGRQLHESGCGCTRNDLASAHPAHNLPCCQLPGLWAAAKRLRRLALARVDLGGGMERGLDRRVLPQVAVTLARPHPRENVARLVL